MGKSIRQDKIIELITANEVDTQEELVELLNGSNFNVTQATVSRDIKELSLIKIAGKTRKYKYAQVNRDDHLDDIKMMNLFKNCVINITAAQNLVLIKTLGGNGNSAGVIVDKMKMEEIVGSVAGDDTLLVVAKSNADAEAVVKKLKELL